MEPTLTLHKLRVFREVVERQSLTLAAQELFVSQPVISGHVRDLEQFFGARLLYQQGRRMLLNDAGKVVHEWVMEVLRSSEDTRGMLRLMNSADAGSASIGTTETPGAYLLPARVTEFKLRHAEAKIALDVGSAARICEQTKSGIFDFSIVAGPEPPATLRSEIFSRDPIVVVCSPQHPLARRKVVTKEELHDLPFVSIARRLAFDDRLRTLGVEEPNIILRLGNVEGLKQAVAAGLGLAVAFRCSVEREVAMGTLVELHVSGYSEIRPFYLVYHPRKRLSPFQLQLIAFLRDWPPQPQTIPAEASLAAGVVRRSLEPSLPA